MEQYKASRLELAASKLKVLELFFAYPTKEFSLNDITERVEIAKTTANAVVTRLIKEGFLHKEEIGKTWRISCNREHHYNITRKVPLHLIQIYESGIIEKIERRYPQASAVVLFGSYRKGDDTEKSDLDIAVEVPEDTETEIVKLGLMQQEKYRKNVAVQATIFCRQKVNINLFANIANGIVLAGFLEARP